MSPKAKEFITPLTVSTLCRHPIYGDDEFWQGDTGGPLHIELAEWADVILLAPLTANTLGHLAHGLAERLMDNVILASRSPVLLAPAMNTVMWKQPVVQQNLEVLLSDSRYHMVGPYSGRLACDVVGVGKMAEPQEIEQYLMSLLLTRGKRDLEGQHVLVTAGGTREYLDPVRFIGNPSSGKMGVAIALAAAHRGAHVTIIVAPGVEVPESLPLNIQPITSAQDMEQALQDGFPKADVTFMAAAVADFKPTKYVSSKLPKSSIDSDLPLTAVPDLVQGLAKQKRMNQKLIGFAAQTGDIIAPAQEKLQRKVLDAIVANPIDQIGCGFGSDRNQAVWLDRHGKQIEIPLMSKLELAHRLLDLSLEL